MAQQDNVVYLGGRVAESKSMAFYQQLQSLSDQRLMAMLRLMLDQVDDALFDRAEKSENNSTQTLYFDAMREVRLKRRDIEESFRQALAEQHAYPLRSRNGAGNAQPPVTDELSLVDNDELEEKLALETMVAKLRGRHAQGLAQLCGKLNVLAGKPVFDESTNPFDPRQIAAAFQLATGLLHADIKCRLVVFKLFERHLCAQIGVFLQEANKMLTDAGFLPNAKPAARETSGEAVRQRQQTRTVLSRPQAEQLLETLQQLLGLDGGLDTRDASVAAGHHHGMASDGTAEQTYSVSDMVSVLSGLQRMPDQEGEDAPLLSSAEIRTQLRSGLARKGAARAHLGRVEDSTIEIVGLLFDVILNDPGIPDRIKALLARLQIPILKVALVDPSLFNHASHPARKLINEMARAGVGWVDGGQTGADLLYQSVAGIVSDILADPGDNIALFNRCLQEFETFLAAERDRARQIENRTRQAAEGKLKVDSARERVDQVLRGRVHGRLLPGVVHRILDQAWSKVLFIPQLKDGDESQAWHTQLTVVDQLIWSVEPKTSHEQRKRLVSEIPGLLQSLRTGMNSIMFNPVEMTHMFKELESEHIRLLSQPLGKSQLPGAGDTVTDYRPPASILPVHPDVAAAETFEAAADAAITAVLKPCYDQLDRAAIGTWFEFIQDSGRSIRAKLSARLGDGDRLIFVNRAGFKLADRRRAEMAHAMSQNRLKILDDNMLFDKALEALVTNLRSMSQKP